MDDLNIKRINELYHKQKKVGLTQEEKDEQQFLRKRYIESIKKNVRGQLEQINIQNEDGTIVNVGEEHEKKHGKKNDTAKNQPSDLNQKDDDQEDDDQRDDGIEDGK